MARCKQSSTRPPNCNFLCLILVTERKKYIYSTNIFFLHSSSFYFFEKVLKRIPSFSSYPFLSFSIFGEIGCFEGSEEIELSSLEKNFDLLARSTVSLQLKFSSCLNYSRIIFIQVQMQIYFYPLFSSIFYRFHPYIYYRKFITIPLSILETLN